MPQEKERRIEHEQGPLLLVALVHAGAQGAHSPSARAKVAVTKSEMQVNLHKIGIKFIRIHVSG